MQVPDDPSKAGWGARINPESRFGCKDWPDWAKPFQREDWAESGLVVWDGQSRTIKRLWAIHAMKLLEEMRKSNIWQQDGLLVRWPAIPPCHEEPRRPAAQARFGEIGLDPCRARELLGLLARNEVLLRRMAEAEEKEIGSCLASAYRFLHVRVRELERGQQGGPKDGEAEIR